jgi:hypothetical protein
MVAQLGTVQTVVVCLNGTSGMQGPCPQGQVQSVTQAYLVAPSEAARFDLMAEPFDAAIAGAYFSFAFASTVFLWLFSLGCGYVLKMVKTG